MVLWNVDLPSAPGTYRVHSPAGRSTSNRPVRSALAVTSSSFSPTNRRVAFARGVIRSSRTTRPWRRPASVRLATRSRRIGLAGVTVFGRLESMLIRGRRGGSDDSPIPAPGPRSVDSPIPAPGGMIGGEVPPGVGMPLDPATPAPPAGGGDGLEHGTEHGASGFRRTAPRTSDGR